MPDIPPKGVRPRAAQQRPRRAAPRKSAPNVVGLEPALTEAIGKLAMLQTGIGVLSGDERHVKGGEVTADFAPRLAFAWTELAKRNEMVARILSGGIENSVTFNVVFATGGFLYAQAQAYEVIPDFGFVNPLKGNNEPDSERPAHPTDPTPPKPDTSGKDHPAAERTVVNPTDRDSAADLDPDIPIDADLMMAAANGGTPAQRPDPINE